MVDLKKIITVCSLTGLLCSPVSAQEIIPSDYVGVHSISIDSSYLTAEIKKTQYEGAPAVVMDVSPSVNDTDTFRFFDVDDDGVLDVYYYKTDRLAVEVSPERMIRTLSSGSSGTFTPDDDALSDFYFANHLWHNLLKTIASRKK